MTIFPFQFPEFLINLLRWKPHIESAENLSDRSLEDTNHPQHAIRRGRSSERLRFKPQLDLCNCRQGLSAWSQRVLRANCRRFLTYDPRMSECCRAKILPELSLAFHNRPSFAGDSFENAGHFTASLQGTICLSERRTPYQGSARAGRGHSLCCVSSMA